MSNRLVTFLAKVFDIYRFYDMLIEGYPITKNYEDY